MVQTTDMYLATSESTPRLSSVSLTILAVMLGKKSLRSVLKT